MKMRLVSLLIATTVCLSAQLVLEDELIIKEILPKVEEKSWEKIPWRVDLWEARREAAEQGKPIYLWEMDGHPLGCV